MSSRVYRRLVAGPDSVRAVCGECDAKVFGDFAILQPETRLAIDGETEKSIELVGHVDAKRLKHLLVEFARPIQIRDGEINMVNHGFPLLADTFNNESVIDCPLLAVLCDTLVCFPIVPIFRRLYVREFCYHDSLNGIALQDFVLPISHQDFNWMSFHCRFNSGPISLKLLLIQCFCSSENNVSGHDCFPFMGSVPFSCGT